MIFLDYDLPNATTWFYFSLFLAVALFFKFSRLPSVRNIDVLALFLLVPGHLLIQEQTHWWWGYLWLLGGTALFLARCLFDLALVQRPSLGPNLAPGGLAWMTIGLFACLVAVTVSRPSTNPRFDTNEPVLPRIASERAEAVVEQQAHANQVTEFDARFWVTRSLAILCHLAVIIGLMVVAWRHFQDVHAGMAAATFYLLLPYTAVHFGQWYHVWPMALVVWAVVFYRHPTVTGLLLGLAAGSVYFPVLIFPAWWGFYRGRGTGRFSGAFLLASGLCLALTGVLLWKAGDLMAHVDSLRWVSAWQPWGHPEGTSQSFWKGMAWGSAYRLPVFVASMALVLGSAVWPMPRNLAHVLALSAAAILSVQFWYTNQGGAYVLWYLPLLLMLVFRPNLTDCRPVAINSETDWLMRAGRLAKRTARNGVSLAAHVVGLPEHPVSHR